MTAVLAHPQHVQAAPRLERPRHEAVYVDLFCGAGGSTTGALGAIRRMFQREGAVRCIVVNHDPQAIATHAHNHPEAEHHDCDIETLDPASVLQGETITVLWASAPCTHFSKARGATPRSDQKRATPNYILHWIRTGKPRIYVEENVWDITTWGPLDAKGKPIKKLRGTLFCKHIREIEALGYRVEYKKLNAADYGDPTTRERFILIAVRDGGPIPWPKQTHSRDGAVPGTLPWVGACTILDRKLEGRSIYGRRTKKGAPRPIASKTRARIARGFRAKGTEWRNVAHDIEHDAGPTPLPRALEGLTVEEAERLLRALLDERVELTLGQQGGAIPRPSSEPVATIPTGGALRRIDADLVVSFDRPETNRSLAREPDQPVVAITTNERIGHVEARILLPPLGYYARGGHANRPRSDEEPVATITAGRGDRQGVVEAHVIIGAGGPAWQGEPRDLARPLGALTTDPHLAVAGAVLVPNFGEREGQPPRFHSLRAPAPAVTGHGAGQLARAVLCAYYGRGTPQELVVPLRTVTTHDRHALAEAVLRLDDLAVDVTMRMLSVRELASAMGFPTSYEFLGSKRAQVRQIGNAVPVHMSEAIVAAALFRAGVAQARIEDYGGSAA